MPTGSAESPAQVPGSALSSVREHGGLPTGRLDRQAARAPRGGWRRSVCVADEMAVVARFVGSALRSADLASRASRRPGPRLPLAAGRCGRRDPGDAVARRRGMGAPWGALAAGRWEASARSERASSAVARSHSQAPPAQTCPEALGAMPTGSAESPAQVPGSALSSVREHGGLPTGRLIERASMSLRAS